jgi:CRISPR/Cas system-associated endonuclease/helicase Cas3
MAQKEESLEDKYSQFAHVVCTCDPEARPGYEPYEHQKETWRALKRLDAPRRGIIALPTGAGKTYTAIHWLALPVTHKSCGGSPMVVAAHNLRTCWLKFGTRATSIGGQGVGRACDQDSRPGGRPGELSRLDSSVV